MTAFWERGYEGVTIAQLATAVGVGPPSLYAAFGDKRALFDEASGRYIEGLDAALNRDLAAPRARDAVAAVLQSAVDSFAADGTPAGCLVMAEPLLEQRRAQTRHAVLLRLQRGVGDGELTKDDVHPLADFVDTVLAGMAARARDGASRTQLDNAAQMALRAWPDPALPHRYANSIREVIDGRVGG